MTFPCFQGTCIVKTKSIPRAWYKYFFLLHVNGVGSFLLSQIISLWNSRFSLACDILRNCYEAFALYSFGRYLIASLGKLQAYPCYCDLYIYTHTSISIYIYVVYIWKYNYGTLFFVSSRFSSLRKIPKFILANICGSHKLSNHNVMHDISFSSINKFAYTSVVLYSSPLINFYKNSIGWVGEWFLQN